MPSRRSLLTVGGAFGLGAALGIGAAVYPVRTHLYDVRLVNRRSAPVDVDLRLAADGEPAYRSTRTLRPSELTHLPCEWPRAAWSYRMAVRPEGHDTWETITWNAGERVCKKVAIEEAGYPTGPVSFYEAGTCPTTLGDHSCG